MDEKDNLNNAIPASSLIKTLAQQKRDLELENLDLRREIEILKDDNKALKNYSVEIQSSASVKDITKLCNTICNLWGQVGKKLGPISELCEKMSDLKGAIEGFVEGIERQQDADIDEDAIRADERAKMIEKVRKQLNAYNALSILGVPKIDVEKVIKNLEG